jgi:hypothetical protein
MNKLITLRHSPVTSFVSSSYGLLSTKSRTSTEQETKLRGPVNYYSRFKSGRQDTVVSSIRKSSGLLSFRTLFNVWYYKEHSVSETGSLAIFKWNGRRYILCVVGWKGRFSITRQRKSPNAL